MTLRLQMYIEYIFAILQKNDNDSVRGKCVWLPSENLNM